MLLLVYVAAISIACLLGWYYQRRKYDTPTLHHVDSDLHYHVLKSKSRFNSPYRIPFWLKNTHLHTIVSFLIKHPKVTFEREYLSLKDGGVIALDWVKDNEESLTESSPILVITLMWTATRKRASSLCNLAQKRGFRVVVFNKRGHGDSVLKTPKLQSIGDCSDLQQCVTCIHERFPQAHLFGHGSSAGCGPLVSYVSKTKEQCLLSAVVFVSPSYNVRRTFADMNWIYMQFLLTSIKKLVWQNRQALKPVVNMKSVLMATNINDFEENVYMKFYGYDDLDKFHKDDDPMREVDNTTIPCLAISSHDDPVCQTNTLPYHLFRDKNYPCRMLVTVPNGGHCGFFEGGFSLESWSDALSVDYLEAVHEYISHKK